VRRARHTRLPDGAFEDILLDPRVPYTGVEVRYD
jgi:hypothetical protein